MIAEGITVAICDVCGKTGPVLSSNPLSQHSYNAIQAARQEGWTLGQVDRCPGCMGKPVPR